ncbi:peptidase [Azospirillum sp. YIM DDC1]|uniref:Peptidase n=1 Tax=Azospirillum aestuarii TaxID=2802052 RepID=A0ABS1I2X0_9PROT|nr:peptidase [Azospirillum aestuarii]MBK3775042.1 peptidase [Azospirillum brasilense]MBK4721320.1 peptidase [Azospirillum aestuarii]
MTYCLGIKTRDGLIGLSDGRITSGSQLSSARKVTMVGGGGDRFFILNSGLRSVRDKTLAYLRRDMSRRRGETYPTMLDALSAFTACLRQVAVEDKEALEASKLAFNLHAIIGGQLAEDREPYMFLVYPEGNWIEVDERTPYLSIGATAYGKPILDRALSYNTDMQTALKIAYLSFDSTRFSSNDVGFPIDMVTFNAEERLWRQSNFDYDDLVEQRLWWNRNITELARRMPDGPWVDTLLSAGARAAVTEEEVV